MISSPESGASFPALTNVTFAGSAMDAEDGNISLNIAWSSSMNGSIGTGSSFSKGNLSPGQHTITASVTDSSLSTVTKQITVTIDTRNGSLIAKVLLMYVGRVKLYLLDCDVEGNSPQDR